MRRSLVLLLSLTFACAAFAAETRRYLVQPKNTIRSMRIAADSLDAAKHRVVTMSNLNVFAADLTAEEAEALRASGEAEIVEEVVEREILGFGDASAITPHAIRYDLQQFVPWGMPMIGAPDVWPVTKGSPDIHVAVVDTGIDYEHPDLAHAYAGGHNIINSEKPPLDNHFHGTHVAGTIAAADNGFGVIGVAPNVKLWAVKVLNEHGKGYSEGLARGFDWILGKSKEVGGRWIVNLSLGSKFGSDVEKAAVARMVRDGIVVVAAAGNDGKGPILYPAGYPGVIAVGAVDSERNLAKFSSWGRGMSIVAPGVAIPSTLRNGFLTSADVARDETLYKADGLTGSPFGSARARLVDCGKGRREEFPTNIRGRIALIQRGEIPFREKSRNAKEAGAIAVVIYNEEGRPEQIDRWTMVFEDCDETGCRVLPEWVDYQFPLTIGVTLADGQKLKAWLDKNVTVGYRPEEYASMSGTSMATPHVAGAAALILSLVPDMSAAQLATVFEKTAIDLEEPGWDLHTAWGLLDLAAAARYAAPEKFGLPRTDPLPPQRKSRGARH